MKNRSVTGLRSRASFIFLLLLFSPVLRGQVPLIDFEPSQFTAEELNAVTGQISHYSGWSVRFGKASITNQAWRQSSGSQTAGQSLRLKGGSSPAVEVERAVTLLANPPNAYVDFYLKPVVECGAVALSGLEVNGAHLAFVRAGSPADDLFAELSGNSSAVVGGTSAVGDGWGVTYVLDGGDDGQPKKWRRLPCRFRLGKDGRTALDWLRLTIRQSLDAGPGGSWDLYVDACMIAANLGYEDRGELFTGSFFFGSESTADVLIDDLQVTLTNPLTSTGGQIWTGDVDEDGLDDAWETAQSGQDPWNVNRESTAGADGKSWLERYVEQGAAQFAQLHTADGLDTDSDGLPDYWEEMFGLDKTDNRDAAVDADGDGYTCLAEFHLGTTPVSPPLYESLVLGPASAMVSVTVLDAVSVTTVTSGGTSTVIRTASVEKSTSGVSLVRQTGTTREVISPPSGYSVLDITSAFINSSGSIAGIAALRPVYQNDVRTYGFLVAANATTTLLFDSGGSGVWTSSQVRGLNDAGQVLLRTTDLMGMEGCWIFDPALSSPYGALPGEATLGWAQLMPDGAALGPTTTSSGVRPTVFRPGQSPQVLFAGVGGSHYYFDSPDGVSRDGAIYGLGANNSGYFIWRWTSTGGGHLDQYSAAGVSLVPTAFRHGEAGCSVISAYQSGPPANPLLFSTTGQSRWIAGTTPLTWINIHGVDDSVLRGANFGSSLPNILTTAPTVFGTVRTQEGVYQTLACRFGKTWALDDRAALRSDTPVYSVVKVLASGHVIARAARNGRSAALVLAPVKDTDGDGMPDDWELLPANHFNPFDATDGALDKDQDGLSNSAEFLAKTDPSKPDSDSDAIPDAWEVRWRLDPNSAADALKDPDGDHLTNLQEFAADSSPWGSYSLADSNFLADTISIADVNASGNSAISYSDAGNGITWQGSVWTGGSSTTPVLTDSWLSSINDNDQVTGSVFDYALGFNVPFFFNGTYLYGLADIVVDGYGNYPWDPVNNYYGGSGPYTLSHNMLPVQVNNGGTVLLQDYSSYTSYNIGLWYGGYTNSLQWPALQGGESAPMAAGLDNDSRIAFTATGDSSTNYAPRPYSWHYYFDPSPVALEVPSGSTAQVQRGYLNGHVLGTSHSSAGSGSVLWRKSTSGSMYARQEVTPWSSNGGLYVDKDVNSRGDILQYSLDEGLLLTKNGVTIPVNVLGNLSGTTLDFYNGMGLDDSGRIIITGQTTASSGRTTIITVEDTGDANHNGIIDDWERYYLGSTGNTTLLNADADGDGLTAAQEYTRGTDIAAFDSDRDGVSDGVEASLNTDPLVENALPTIRISEIQPATGSSGNFYENDGDGNPANDPQMSLESYAWIELHNAGGSPQSLAGWKLEYSTTLNGTPSTFQFYTTVIPAGGYKVFKCSGYGYESYGHVAIMPGAQGGVLKLKNAAGTVVHLLTYSGGAVANQKSFSSHPSPQSWDLAVTTPGQPSALDPQWRPRLNPPALVTTTHAGAAFDAMLFNEAIVLRVTPEPRADITYVTRDGSEPGPNNPSAVIVHRGTTGVIPIETTASIRAVSVTGSARLRESLVSSLTRIRPRDVPYQSAPKWYADLATGDPAITGVMSISRYIEDNLSSTSLPSPAPSVTFEDSGNLVTPEQCDTALHALPVVALTVAPDDLLRPHDPATTSPPGGIQAWPMYRGAYASRSARFEFDNNVTATPARFNGDIQVAIHDDESAKPSLTDKHSFNLTFSSSAGNGMLLGDSTVRNELLLISAAKDSVAVRDYRLRRSGSYIDSAWLFKTFGTMGHATPRRRFTNVFINGLYWGLYEIVEKADVAFAQRAAQGTSYNSFATVSAQSLSTWRTSQAQTPPANPAAFNTAEVRAHQEWMELTWLAAEVFRRQTEYVTQGHQSGLPPDQQPNDPYPVLLSRLISLNEFIDCVLLNVFAANEDSPSSSFALLHRAASGSSTPGTFSFVPTEAQESMGMFRDPEKSAAIQSFAWLAEPGHHPGRVFLLLMSDPRFRQAVSQRLDALLADNAAFHSPQITRADGAIVARLTVLPVSGDAADRYLQMENATLSQMPLEDSRWLHVHAAAPAGSLTLAITSTRNRAHQFIRHRAFSMRQVYDQASSLFTTWFPDSVSPPTYTSLRVQSYTHDPLAIISQRAKLSSPPSLGGSFQTAAASPTATSTINDLKRLFDDSSVECGGCCSTPGGGPGSPDFPDAVVSTKERCTDCDCQIIYPPYVTVEWRERIRLRSGQEIFVEDGQGIPGQRLGFLYKITLHDGRWRDQNCVEWGLEGRISQPNCLPGTREIRGESNIRRINTTVCWDDPCDFPNVEETCQSKTFGDPDPFDPPPPGGPLPPRPLVYFPPDPTDPDVNKGGITAFRKNSVTLTVGPDEPVQLNESHTSGGRFRKIGLDGKPLSAVKPQQSAESDERSEDSYVDSLTLQLHHETSDFYLPLPGGQLSLAVKRSAIQELFTAKGATGTALNESRRIIVQGERPFGMAWNTGIAPHIRHEITYGSNGLFASESIAISDENGDSHRFSPYPGANGGNPVFLPVPSGYQDTDCFGNTLSVSGSNQEAAVFKRRFGTTLRFDLRPAIKYFRNNTEVRYYRLVDGSGDLHSIEDRMGNALDYFYPQHTFVGGAESLSAPANAPGGVQKGHLTSPATLLPDRIVAKSGPNGTGSPRIHTTLHITRDTTIGCISSIEVFPGDTVSSPLQIIQYEYDLQTPGSLTSSGRWRYSNNNGTDPGANAGNISSYPTNCAPLAAVWHTGNATNGSGNLERKAPLLKSVKIAKSAAPSIVEQVPVQQYTYWIDSGVPLYEVRLVDNHWKEVNPQDQRYVERYLLHSITQPLGAASPLSGPPAGGAPSAIESPPANTVLGSAAHTTTFHYQDDLISLDWALDEGGWLRKTWHPDYNNPCSRPLMVESVFQSQNPDLNAPSSPKVRANFEQYAASWAQWDNPFSLGVRNYTLTGLNGHRNTTVTDITGNVWRVRFANPLLMVRKSLEQWMLPGQSFADVQNKAAAANYEMSVYWRECSIRYPEMLQATPGPGKIHRETAWFDVASGMADEWCFNHSAKRITVYIHADEMWPSHGSTLGLQAGAAAFYMDRKFCSEPTSELVFHRLSPPMEDADVVGGESISEKKFVYYSHPENILNGSESETRLFSGLGRVMTDSRDLKKGVHTHYGIDVGTGLTTSVTISGPGNHVASATATEYETSVSTGKKTAWVKSQTVLHHHGQDASKVVEYEYPSGSPGPYTTTTRLKRAGGDIITTDSFNALGQKTFSSIPSYGTASTLGTSFFYDARGHITRTTNAAGFSTDTWYNARGQTVVTRSPGGIVSQQQSDFLGRPIQSGVQMSDGSWVRTYLTYHIFYTARPAGALEPPADPLDAEFVPNRNVYRKVIGTEDALHKHSYKEYNALGLLMRSWKQSGEGNPGPQNIVNPSITSAFYYDLGNTGENAPTEGSNSGGNEFAGQMFTPVKIVDPEKNVTFHRFDDLGRETDRIFNFHPATIEQGAPPANEATPGENSTHQWSWEYTDLVVGADRTGAPAEAVTRMKATSPAGIAAVTWLDANGRAVKTQTLAAPLAGPIISAHTEAPVITETSYLAAGPVEVRAVTSGTQVRITSRTVYDQAGRAVEAWQLKPDGSSGLYLASSTEYDAAGNAIKTTAFGGFDPQTAPKRTSESRYDVLNRKILSFGPVESGLLRCDQPHGDNPAYVSTPDVRSATGTWYDPDGRPTGTRTGIIPAAVQNPTREDLLAAGASHRVSSNLYDNLGRVKQAIVRNDVPGQPSIVLQTDTGYDANGNVVSVTDPQGRQITNEYDALNRQISTTIVKGMLPVGASPVAGQPSPNITTTFEYDRNGRRIKTIDGAGRITNFRYDGAGRLCYTVRDPGASQKVEITNYWKTLEESRSFGLGDKSVFLKFDTLGRLVKKTFPASLSTAGSVVESRHYDAWGNFDQVLHVASPDVRDVAQEFDALGRITAECSAGRWHHYEYDLFGSRTRAHLDAAGPTDLPRRNLSYAYDSVGRMTGCVERTGNSTSETGLVTSWVYNDRGLAARQFQANGNLVEQFADDLGRLLRTTQYARPGSGGTRPILYSQFDMEYDGSGNLTRFKENYFAAGVLKTRAVENSYDGAGRLLLEKSGGIL